MYSTINTLILDDKGGEFLSSSTSTEMCGICFGLCVRFSGDKSGDRRGGAAML